MPHKLIKYKPIGMNRDLSISAANPKYAYTINNMRIINNEETGDLSLINEKGTTLKLTTSGIVTGVVEANDKVVLFGVTGEGKSFIDLLDLSSLSMGLPKNLYKGNLNFSTDHPIEGIFNFETETIQKVYWVDGINLLRVINIAADLQDRNMWDDDSFNVILRSPMINSWDILIDKNENGNGQFPGGTVQYFITYTNNMGVETSFVYISPKYYTSKNKGEALSAEEICNNTFNIKIHNYNPKYEYLNIYSIITTGYSSREVKLITLIKIDQILDDYLEYIDTNIQGESIDLSSILFKIKPYIKPKTIEAKLGTLFLGNYSLNYNSNIEIWHDRIKEIISLNIYTDYNRFNYDYSDSLYPYESGIKKYNSQEIKSFKYGETYRLGIVLLDKYGNTSNVIHIGDIKMDKAPFHSQSAINTWHFKSTFDYDDEPLGLKDIIYVLRNYSYDYIIPVICYPSLHDRTVLCQGVLNPVVCSYEERLDTNGNFASSSWFFRPIQLRQMNKLVASKYDNPVEFRHMFGIASSAYDSNHKMIDEGQEYRALEYISEPDFSLLGIPSPYTVDNTIITLNSPDLELSEELDNFDFTGCRCRIVGYIPVDSRRSYHTMAANHALDFLDNVKTYFNTDGYNKASQHIAGSKFRLDLGSTHYVDSNNPLPSPGLSIYEDVNIYPWNSSILHKKYTEEDIEKIVKNKYGSGYVVKESFPTELGTLKYNRTSNLLISSRTRYLNHPVDFYNEDKGVAQVEHAGTIIPTHNSITTPILFNSKENMPIYIPHPNGKNINVLYSGNVDRIINSGVQEDNDDLACHIQYKSTKHLVFGIKYSRDDEYKFQVHQILPTPFVISTEWGWKQVANSVKNYALYGTNQTPNFWSETDYGEYLMDKKTVVTYKFIDEIYDNYDWGWFNYSRSYERTDGWWADGIILDAIELLDYQRNSYFNTDGIMASFPKEGSFDYNLKDMGILWLGEIYRDIPNSQKFGGNSEQALLNNTWYIAGNTLSLEEIEKSDTVQLEWNEGDTYFQRYDTLKTYSGSMENKNNVTEILSFFCESRVNPDSRYDNNRNKQDNTPMTPTNFNLINPAYTLQNNFTDVISYRSIPDYIYENIHFPVDIIWSLPKKAGEKIDAWTNINTVSSISLNGRYGNINAIRIYNDSLMVFQDKGISNLLYNENVQIASTTGIPIEIANSGKVDGYRILSDNYGCVNKWSIQNTKKGLYFIDDYNKDIVFFNGQFKSLSREKGFNYWIKNYINSASQAFTLTTPSLFGNIITHYDKITDDIYFVTDTEALNYSEVLDEFQAFLSYGGAYKLFNLKGNSYIVQNNFNNLEYSIHQMYAGDYNNLLDIPCDYGIELLVNPDPTQDKIFNTVEFRSDTWSGGSLTNDTFDYLSAETEYQHGTSILQNKQGYPSNLKNKFRIWRANIPRDNSNNRDRIRNTWAKIKLHKYNFLKEKTVLHDVQINYFA